MSFDFNAYLNRIGIARPEPTLAGLSALQQAQLSAIPFENINPLLGLLPDLDPAALMDKIVASRRGGYCFELNGLFEHALNELGFAYQPIMARVRMGRSEGGPRLHLGFIVEADGESWLVDVGFGGPSHYRPLRLGTEQEQMLDHNRFRLRLEAESGKPCWNGSKTATGSRCTVSTAPESNVATWKRLIWSAPPGTNRYCRKIYWFAAIPPRAGCSCSIPTFPNFAWASKSARR